MDKNGEVNKGYIDRRRLIKAGVGVGLGLTGLGKKQQPAQAAPHSDPPSQAVSIPQPLDVVRVTEQKSSKEIVLKSCFGIRCDEASALPEALELGAGAIRVDAAQGTTKDIKKIAGVVQDAMKSNIEIDLIFRPQQPLPDKELQKRLDELCTILGTYKKVTFELGNEPDDTNTPYWKDQDLKTFAHFVKVSSDIVRKRYGNAKITVGALVNVEDTTDLLYMMEGEGAKLYDFYFALHAYNEVSDLEYKFALLKKALAGKNNIPSDRIIATELGRESEEKGKLYDMIQRSFAMGIQQIYVHQLVDYENNHFGFVTEQDLRTKLVKLSVL